MSNVFSSSYPIGSLSSGGRQIGAYNPTTSLGIIANGVSWFATTAANTIGVVNQVYIGEAFSSNTGTTTTTKGSSYLLVNGKSQSTTNTVTYWSAGSVTTLGAQVNNNSTSSPFAGNIYEVLAYSTVLSLADRQKVEGYLAWKWNLVTYLPSGHYYTGAAPSF
jgi:hypothetical protein